jgi:hypothetical protein
MPQPPLSTSNENVPWWPIRGGLPRLAPTSSWMIAASAGSAVL